MYRIKKWSELTIIILALDIIHPIVSRANSTRRSKLVIVCSIKRIISLNVKNFEINQPCFKERSYTKLSILRNSGKHFYSLIKIWGNICIQKSSHGILLPSVLTTNYYISRSSQIKLKNYSAT